MFHSNPLDYPIITYPSQTQRSGTKRITPSWTTRAQRSFASLIPPLMIYFLPTRQKLDLYPPNLQSEINEWVYPKHVTVRTAVIQMVISWQGPLRRWRVPSVAGSSYHPNLRMRKRSTRSSKLWIRWLLSLPGKDYVVGGSTQTLYVTAVRNFHAKTRLFTNCRYQTIVNVMLQHWCPSAVCRYFSVLTVTVKIPYVNVDLPAQIALYKGWREISGKGHGNLPW